MEDFRVPRKQRVPSPQISGKRVTLYPDRGEARYFRQSTQPRHPEAAYSIPSRHRPGWRIDVILLVAAIVLAATFVISLMV